jgi:hypothetical protein
MPHIEIDDAIPANQSNLELWKLEPKTSEKSQRKLFLGAATSPVLGQANS